jgi:hypothetical protein
MKLLFENWNKYLNEQNIMDKLAHLEDEGKKDTAQQIIDTARTLLIYEQMRDDIKALVDELIAFNREQFGSDAGKWAQKSAPEPDDTDELEIY